MSAPQGALEGIRVLDFSRLAPGPMASTILADLGAEVIKVEEPGGGRRAREERQLRGEDPDTFTPDEIRRRKVSPLERNKRSIALNLRLEAGKSIAVELAKRSDVVLEGFRPGVMTRLGLGYEALRALHPGLVYCAITGYGQSGPRALLPGHDLTYLADAGALSLIGDENGEPVVPINIIADYAAGSYRAVIGILAALRARERTGRGQFVDVAMADGVLALISPEVAAYAADGRVPRAAETRLTGGMAYYNVYRTKDGEHIAIGCNEPHFFRALCEAMDLNELIGEQLVPRAEQKGLKRRFAERFLERTLDEWLSAFEGKEIAYSPVRSIDEVVADPHYRARGMLTEVPLPGGERVVQVAPAVMLSETPPAIRHAAPIPGEDTAAILRELGHDDDRIALLKREGVVA